MAEPTNQMLKLAKRLLSLSEQLTRSTIVTLLDEESLYALSWTCKDYRNQYKDKYVDKKAAADRCFYHDRLEFCSYVPTDIFSEKF